MRKILYTSIAATILMASCRSSSYFTTPNNLRNITGTLYLTNGKAVDGKLVVNSEAFMNRAVRVYEAGERKPMRFPLSDISAYSIRQDYYALKEIEGGFPMGKRVSFMKRLTREDSRIHLFEHTEKKTHTGPNNTTTTSYETQYFLQLPGENGNGVWALNSSKFVPDFDGKVSRLVADCPSLSQKIANREPGYFYAQVSLFGERRAEVMLRIIKEYNQCN